MPGGRAFTATPRALPAHLPSVQSHRPLAAQTGNRTTQPHPHPHPPTHHRPSSRPKLTSPALYPSTATCGRGERSSMRTRAGVGGGVGGQARKAGHAEAARCRRHHAPAPPPLIRAAATAPPRLDPCQTPPRAAAAWLPARLHVCDGSSSTRKSAGGRWRRLGAEQADQEERSALPEWLASEVAWDPEEASAHTADGGDSRWRQRCGALPVVAAPRAGGGGGGQLRAAAAAATELRRLGVTAGASSWCWCWARQACDPASSIGQLETCSRAGTRWRVCSEADEALQCSIGC